MHTFFADYLNLLKKCHDDIHKTINGLPPEALDWVPGAEMNSICVLVYHITGAERFWIGDVAVNEPSNRDRNAEFKVRGLGEAFLRGRLDDSYGYATAVLEQITLQDLETPRTSSRGTFTVGWALLHALEHSHLHLGHLQITRQLWDQTKGNQ